MNLTPCVPLSLRGRVKERGKEFERGLAPPLAAHFPGRREKGKKRKMRGWRYSWTLYIIYNN